MADGHDTVGVLLVAGDRGYRDSLAGDLLERGFAVKRFADGAALLESLNAAVDAPADAGVIILDWNIPKASGIDLLPELRRHGVDLPVVFLARRAHAEHESLAFDRGAIDFIDKARGVEVLVRRLRRVLDGAKRAAVPRVDEPMVRGRLVLQPKASRAYWDEVDVGLSLGEYNVVHLLASTVGRHVTYRAIYDRMHYEGFIAGSGEDGYRANVRSAIKRIRRKFRERDAAFAEIENYTAFGYRWRKPGSGS